MRQSLNVARQLLLSSFLIIIGGVFVLNLVETDAWAQPESVSSPTSSLKEQKSKAVKLFDEQRFAEAVPVLRSILARAPSDRDARILLTFCLDQLGQKNQAIQEGRRALTLAPDHPQLQLLLAQLLSQQQQRGSETIQLYRAVLKRDPKNLQAWLGLAETYLLSGNTIEALPHYRRLVATKPDEAFYSLRLGQTYGALGQLQKAKQNYLRAYKLDPKNIDALQFLAILADVEDNLDEAIRHYRELLKWHPDNSAAQVALLQLEQSPYEPRLDRRAFEIQKIPLSTYLTALDTSNTTVRERLEQLAVVEKRANLRYLPSFFFSPGFVTIDAATENGDTDTRSFNFSFGWNLPDLFVDNYSITKQSLQADLSQLRRILADEVTRVYYVRQTELATYLQLQRSIVLDPLNTQLRNQRRFLKNSIIEKNERLQLLSGIR